ncbi:hypothetical protein J7L84_01805 [Candidatus Bipolaricaulota bacterium]|nr:hypothetical protein [Candidatus Bipolaricaulota bacterium]
MLGFLVTLADEQGVVELTRAQLAAARSVSISTISRAIKELLKAGEIELVKEGGGRGRPSRYRIIWLARGGGSAPRGSGGRHRPVPRALTGEVAVKLCHRKLVHDPVLDPETLRKSAAEAGEVLIAGIVGFLQGAARAWRQLPTWQRTVLAGLPLGTAGALLGWKGGGKLWAAAGGGVGLLAGFALALLVPEEKPAAQPAGEPALPRLMEEPDTLPSTPWLPVLSGRWERPGSRY